jgi:hypothetical protein
MTEADEVACLQTSESLEFARKERDEWKAQAIAAAAAANAFQADLVVARETELQLRKRIDCDAWLLQNAVRPDVHEMIRQRAERFHAENVAIQASHARLVEAAERTLGNQDYDEFLDLRAALSESSPTEHPDTARLRVLRAAAERVNQSSVAECGNEDGAWKEYYAAQDALEIAMSDAPVPERKETFDPELVRNLFRVWDSYCSNDTDDGYDVGVALNAVRDSEVKP